MLAKNSFYYLFAHGIPSLINFSAVIIYTRLLSPDEYGQYALIIAAVSFFNMFLYEWLHLGLLRFLPARQISKQTFLSTVLVAFIVVSLFGLAIAIDMVLFNNGKDKLLLFVLGLLLFWVWGFFHINLQLKTAQLLPAEYGRLAAGKSVFSLAIGIPLVWYGYGAQGLLIALSTAMVLAMLIWARKEWQQLSLKRFDKQLMRKLILYGFPLAANLALAEVISSSDRVFLVWLHDMATTGLYSVGYDLANHILGVLLMIINLSAYPLAITALEKHGKPAAIKQLRQNFVLIIAVALPAATGLAILAPGICRLFLGEQFQQAAENILPWVAAAAFIAGLKSYYFDLAFQLGKHTLGQVKILFVAALVNVLLNLLLIPDYSVMGAIYATLAAYFIGLLLSLFMGRKWFKLPVPGLEVIKVLTATFIMGLATWPFRSNPDVLSLFIAIGIGILAYILMITLLNVSGVRDLLKNFLVPSKHAG
jgi:O-antigen/teichoic acid export membrane protein